MTGTRRWSQRVACAVGLLFCTLLATPSWASVIYEYREVGSSAVIGRLEIESPPASDTSGWSTTDPTDLIALTLADSVFGLGIGNLLPGAVVGAAVLSLGGSKLDVGTVTLSFPTIIPPNPLDPTIDQFMSLHFGVAAGTDSIGLATISTFPDGSVTTTDLFRFGDWTAVGAVPVPEPGTAVLVLIGLAAAGGAARRRRR
jgi:hypothetical protein